MGTNVPVRRWRLCPPDITAGVPVVIHDPDGKVIATCCNQPTGQPLTPAGSPPSAPSEAPPTPAAGKPAGLPAAAFGPYAVLRVVDGDTLHVSIGGRDTTLRLSGMDTPKWSTRANPCSASAGRHPRRPTSSSTATGCG